MAQIPLIQAAEQAARAAGISPSLVGATVPRDGLGDGAAIFREGSLLIRFVRDRGQDLIDVAPEVRPRRFHLADDLEIALGWKTVDEILAMNEPEPLEHTWPRGWHRGYRDCRRIRGRCRRPDAPKHRRSREAQGGGLRRPAPTAGVTGIGLATPRRTPSCSQWGAADSVG